MERKPAEKTKGIYRLISLPRFYKFLMDIIGADTGRKRYIEEWLELTGKERILDVACGPGTITSYLHYREYLGLDINEKHIARADRIYGDDNTTFIAGAVEELIPNIVGKYDRILCNGFLHHVDDASVEIIINSLLSHLTNRGFISIVEPIYLQNQRHIARIIKNLDSGQHIRTYEQWRLLLDDHIYDERVYGNLLRIPYDHLLLKLR